MICMGASRAGAAPAPLNVSFTKSLFTQVNENDAKASMKAWGQAVAKERSIAVDPRPKTWNDVGELRSALQRQEVDLLGLTVTAYAALGEVFEPGNIFFASDGKGTTERYVLLVHSDGPVTNLAGLRNRTLNIHTDPRLCLATFWLDTILAQAGGAAHQEYLGEVIQSSKLSAVVLPVFFKQKDACLVTEAAFRTMAELNPQLSRKLVPLAVSEEFVTMLFVFRKDYAPPFLSQLVQALRELHLSVAGQQVLTIFRIQRLEEGSAASLASAFSLMEAHARMFRATTAGQDAGSSAVKETEASL